MTVDNLVHNLTAGQSQGYWSIVGSFALASLLNSGVTLAC